MCVVAALIDSLCPVNVVIILVIKGTNPLKTGLMSRGGRGGGGGGYEFCKFDICGVIVRILSISIKSVGQSPYFNIFF